MRALGLFCFDVIYLNVEYVVLLEQLDRFVHCKVKYDSIVQLVSEKGPASCGTNLDQTNFVSCLILTTFALTWHVFVAVQQKKYIDSSLEDIRITYLYLSNMFRIFITVLLNIRQRCSNVRISFISN